jgi:hypothetical protein
VNVKQTILSLIVAGALATAACSTGADTTSPLTTAPTTPPITENFSGTVQVAGTDAHPFTVTASGAPITLALTTAGPPATIFMGFGLGSWDGTTCTLQSGGFTTTPAGATPQLSGNIAPGQYCVMVYDVGNQSAPITYTAVVAHY